MGGGQRGTCVERARWEVTSLTHCRWRPHLTHLCASLSHVGSIYLNRPREKGKYVHGKGEKHVEASIGLNW